MKILYLTKYSRLGASSRLRSFQYIPFLEEKGMHVTVKPLFNDAYLQKLYSGQKNRLSSLKGYFKRLLVLLTLGRYDRIVIEKELFPYLPAVFERILATLGIRYIVDYDDAIFHNYDMHANPFIRTLLKNKIDTVMKKSQTVIAGNTYLAERAQDAGANNIVIIPTVIDTRRYRIKEFANHVPFVIGWIGSPSTFKYLFDLKSVFEKLSLKYDIAIHVVGAKASLGLLAIEKHIPWSEASEVDSILTFDVGIMPLQDTPWEKGKCSYKLIQYMGCGIPVIASAIGMNMDVVKPENGFLVKTEDEWYTAIETYILNWNLIKHHGERNISAVEERYSLTSTKSVYINAITA